MKKLFILSLFVLCMICTSCTESFESLDYSTSYVDNFSTSPYQLPVDTVFQSDLKTQNMSRSLPLAMSASDDEFREVFETGYNGTPENGSNVKQLFDTQLANLTGLIAGNVYITRYEAYYKVVNLNGSEFYDDETYESCGLRKRPELLGGSISYTDRGYYSMFVNDNQVKLTTYLIHVISDLSGKKLDIYYPCHPSNIKWHYYLFN